MTTLTDTQVITASGGLVELGYSQITSSVTVGTSVTNVTSTLTVVCDGGPILVEFFAPSARCFAGGDNLTFSLFEDGVQKASPWGESVSSNDLQATPVQLQYRLTPSAGSHTYQVKAISSLSSSQQVRAGSGGTGSPAYSPAFLRVSKIVTATQWPAVTTGTIICTSSTRPASPFEGQTIYETDTKRSWTRVGTQWVPDDMVFTNEAARDAAITSPTEGMRAYLTAPTVPAATGGTTAVPTGVVTIYNGSVWVCVTPVNAIQTATGTTTSSTYTATLSGSPGTNPSVTLTTGTTALLMLSVTGSVNPAPTTIAAGVAVSGATTRAVAGDSNAVYVGISGGYIGMMSCAKVITGLTAGTNTFTIQYLSGAGNTASFYDRSVTVQGIA